MISKPIPYGRQHITDEDIRAVIDTLKSDYLTQGPKIREFETKFAEYVGAQYAVAVNNATSGLHLAATALNVKPGDKVIVTPMTFAASANCIRYCGGEVVFCDIDKDTYLMDIRKLEAMLKASPRGTYKGIVPVDFAGYPLDLEEFRKLADEYGLWIIEDACHAPGGYFMDSKGKKQHCGNGCFADCAVFSFHPVKHIATGEGGMVTTNSKELYDRLCLFRTHGITKDPALLHEHHGGWYYEMQELGYNYRLTDFQAALGISQLERAKAGLERRHEIVRRYNEAFSRIDGIKTPFNAADVYHAYHLYIIQVSDRLGLYNYLHENNVYAQVHYAPLHLMPYYQLNGWAAEYFANYLQRETEGQSVGLAYFRQKRGMTDATIKKFGLGFCPAKGDRMSKDALAAGYKKEFLLSTGLSLVSDRDGSLYDRFRDRVIFPVHNISGRIVAFGGRTLRTDKQVAKYQNSPESEIYSKKRELYGLYFAKKAIQQQDFAIMVEGYTDVISMHQAGVENVVSSSGTSLTTEQIRLLNRFTKNITVIYDGDSAGIHASLRGIDMILKEGMNVRVVLLPEPEDPDSFARSHTASELQEYIRANEQDFLEFKAKLLLQDAEGDPIRKAALIADMVQSVSVIPDPIQRSVYIKECARIMDIDEQILISEVARKRMTTSGDRETDEFLRRQTTLRQREAQQPGVEFVKQVEAGSSFETLEREIV